MGDRGGCLLGQCGQRKVDDSQGEWKAGHRSKERTPAMPGTMDPGRGATESAMCAHAGAAEFEDEIGDHDKVDEEQDEFAGRGSVKEFVDFER